jgi:hypothetical protein
MLSLSMRILWLRVSYAVILISSSSRFLGEISYCEMEMEHPKHLQNFCSIFCMTSIILYPPDEEEVLQYLVFQSILPSRIL